MPEGAKALFKSQASTVMHQASTDILARIPDFHKRFANEVEEDDPLEEEQPGWSVLRLRICRILVSKRFETFIAMVIFVNMGLAIIETDRRALCEEHGAAECPPTSDLARLGGDILLSIYILEVSARIWVYRTQFHQNYWNCFDFLIVALGVTGELFGGFLANLSIIRVVRMARIVRIFRLLTAYRELYLMINGFVSTMKTILWASFLLGICISILSMLSVEVLHPLQLQLAAEGRFDSCERCARMFQSVFHSNLTFFQILVAGDSWGTAAITLIEAEPWTALILGGAVVSISMGISNLIIAVICEKAQEAQAQDERFNRMLRKKAEHEAKAKLMDVCVDLDSDGSGELSLEELVTNIGSNANLQKALEYMDVERGELAIVFEMMDCDKSGSVSYSEFVDTLFKLKSGDSATQIGFIKFHVSAIKNQVTKEMSMLKEVLDDLAEMARLQPVALSDADTEPKLVLPPGEIRFAAQADAHAQADTSSDCLLNRFEALCSELRGGIPRIIAEQLQSELLTQCTALSVDRRTPSARRPLESRGSDLGVAAPLRLNAAESSPAPQVARVPLVTAPAPTGRAFTSCACSSMPCGERSAGERPVVAESPAESAQVV